MKPSRYRWFVFAVFFLFMLSHQSDKLLISPLTTPIMNEFGVNEAQMGLVFSGAIVVGAVLYPIWGYLYDRYMRARLLALAAFIWGATTWLSALVRTFPAFTLTRASTGIDDSSYPGLYNIIADYFEPHLRGKVNGLLQISMPLGYMIGMILAMALEGAVGWRGVFYITGSLGIVLAAVIFVGVREPRRGSSEPELQGLEQGYSYRFDWRTARDLLKKPSLLFLFANGFFGVFPWQVVTFWFFRYLETERGYTADERLMTMVIAVLVLASGYPIGGALGDWLFKRTLRGRMIVSSVGVVLGAVLMAAALSVSPGEKLLFGLMICLTTLFMPFAAPNVTSTLYDITLPEVRSTANALQNFVEQAGSAAAPFVAGVIAVGSSLHDAILYLNLTAWLFCFVCLVLAAYFVPRDVLELRRQLRARADLERARLAGAQGA